MSTVKAEGRLRHCFWGTYYANIALGFADEKSADDALCVLNEKDCGVKWAKSDKNTSVLTWFGTSDQLKVCKSVLGYFGADEDKIDSIAKSIDFGEPFSVKIDVTPKEQLTLF